MFYDSDKQKQLVNLLSTFDDHSVIILVGSLNEDRDNIDMNIVSQLEPIHTFEHIAAFLRNYYNQNSPQPVEKPNLKIVRD